MSWCIHQTAYVRVENDRGLAIELQQWLIEAGVRFVRQLSAGPDHFEALVEVRHMHRIRDWIEEREKRLAHEAAEKRSEP